MIGSGSGSGSGAITGAGCVAHAASVAINASDAARRRIRRTKPSGVGSSEVIGRIQTQDQLLLKTLFTKLGLGVILNSQFADQLQLGFQIIDVLFFALENAFK